MPNDTTTDLDGVDFELPTLLLLDNLLKVLSYRSHINIHAFSFAKTKKKTKKTPYGVVQ